MKTLTQLLEEQYGKSLETQKLTIPVIKNIIKKWLCELQKEYEDIWLDDWKDIVITELLVELEK